MRFYSYVFHGVLALFLLAVSGLALLSGSSTLTLDMLPWRGANLAYWLFFSALFGLLSVILAMKGMLRPLFLLWSLAVLVMLVRGYFLSSYVFEPGEFQMAAYLTAGALLAVFGAWFQMSRRRLKTKR